MRRYFIINLLLIAFTAPWIFLAAGQGASFAGLPGWALYTVGSSTVYAIFVAISYVWLWDKNAKAEADD